MGALPHGRLDGFLDRGEEGIGELSITAGALSHSFREHTANIVGRHGEMVQALLQALELDLLRPDEEPAQLGEGVTR
jgi:hypothetical protein